MYAPLLSANIFNSNMGCLALWNRINLFWKIHCKSSITTKLNLSGLGWKVYWILPVAQKIFSTLGRQLPGVFHLNGPKKWMNDRQTI